MRRGDYRAIEIRRERIPDGMGGERDGIAIRLWVDDADEDSDELLMLTMLMADENVDVPPPVRDTIDHVLSVFELNR